MYSLHEVICTQYIQGIPKGTETGGIHLRLNKKEYILKSMFALKFLNIYRLLYEYGEILTRVSITVIRVSR